MKQYKLLSISQANDGKHRMKAVFENKQTNSTKTTYFGAKDGSTYIDHKDDEKKRNYIARHREIENWNDPTAAGTLARYILWNKKSLSSSIQDYRRRFNV